MSKKQWAMVVGVVVLMAYGYRKVRGIRNNNPGNLRRNGVDWQGLRQIQTDHDFYQFVNAKYGIRALAKLLINYDKKYGLDTVEKILNRYAPSYENDTSAYARFVASKLGVGVGERFDVVSRLKPLVLAIIQYENGVQPYSEETINEAIAMV